MKQRRNSRKSTPVDDAVSHRPEDQAEEVQSAVESTEVEVDVIRADGRPMYQLDTRPSEALVIHCADPRFQTAFRRFVTEELGIEKYAPLVIGGGPHAFGMQSLLPKNFKVLWEQVKFFITQAKVRRVIIINHEDCLWYRSKQGYHPTIALPIKGKLDLHQAAKTILRDFAGVQVESYWGALEGERVYFLPVEGKVG